MRLSLYFIFKEEWKFCTEWGFCLKWDFNFGFKIYVFEDSELAPAGRENVNSVGPWINSGGLRAFFFLQNVEVWFVNVR